MTIELPFPQQTTQFVIDFETYYDAEYSLRKMPMSKYVRDNRFEILGCVIYNVHNQQFHNIDGPDVARIGREFPIKDSVLIAHNAPFDGLILNERLNLSPKFWVDTLAMARAIYGQRTSCSLENLAAFLSLKNKLIKHYDDFKGFTWDELTANQRGAMFMLCKRDVELTSTLFQHLIYCGGHRLSRVGMEMIDMCTRMTTEPFLRLNLDVLFERYEELTEKRDGWLAEARVYGANCATDIISNDRFARVLMQNGAEEKELPHEVSHRSGKKSWNFAANNPDFTALLEHANEYVARLVKLRLDIKSDTERKRCQAYVECQGDSRTPWCVGINYAGAVTTLRQSGNNAGGGNPQNLSRGSALREAVEAPPGHVLVVGDSSQVELRMGLYLAGFFGALRRLHEGHDLYVEAYADAMGISPEDVDEQGRFVGKVMELQLQYQTGKFGLLRTLRNAGISMEEMSAEAMVRIYRAKRHKTTQLWFGFQNALQRIGSKSTFNLECGYVLTFDWEQYNTLNVWVEQGGSNGRHARLALQYPNVEIDHDTRQHFYKHKDKDESLYGGKIWQNFVQHMTYKLMEIQAVGFHRATGEPVRLMAHDEIVCAPKRQHALKQAALLRKILRTTPPGFGPELLLDGKVNIAKNYKEAK